MFLFTTSAAPKEAAQPGASPVLRAIADGAKRSGTDFDFLVRTAQRESALDPNAKARTSSATGLFQFIEQTWLDTLKTRGPQHGLGEFSAAITTGADGRHQVADPALREQILELRRNPVVASVMAGELTRKNSDALRQVLGQEPGAGDLYAAHVLGAKGAAELIRAVQANPDQSAARLFPDAADANRNIFFERNGRARSVAEVQGWLANGHRGGAHVAPVQEGEQPFATLAPARQRGLIGLFSTEGQRGPVSQAVARHWATSTGMARQSATANAGYLRYFPQAAGASEVAVPEPASQALVTAPLPPERPSDLKTSMRFAKGRPLDILGPGGRT